MPSPLRPNDDQAHPDPPSPPPTPAPSASTAAASSSAAHASSGVGDVGSTSGRSRFYDALRRIGFPHLPARSRESAPAAGHAPAAEEGPAAGPSQPEQAPVSGGPSGSTPEGVGRGPRTGAVPTPPLPSPAAVPSPELNAPSDTPPPTGGSPLALANAAAAPPAAAAEHGPAAAPDPSSSIPRGQPYFGLDIMLDANGGPPPTREEMEILMRSLFGPTVQLPAQTIGPTLGGAPGVPTIQAIPPPGMFAALATPEAAPAPASAVGSGLPPNGAPGAPSSGSPPASAHPVPPQPSSDGALPTSSAPGPAPAPAAAAAAAGGGDRPPAPGGLGQLINQFIANLVQQHRAASAASGAPLAPGSMPVLITFSFGSPSGPLAGLSDEKVPDPERAAELLGALTRPSKELVERLDHALRCEEHDAGVDEMERTGAQCSVCMDSLMADRSAAEPAEEVVSLPCGHVFHVACLEPWLETNTNCPTCRFDLDPLSTTLRPHRRTPGRAATAPSPAEAGAIPSATGANAQGRGHPYARSPASRPGTPTTGGSASRASTPASSVAAPAAVEGKKYVLPAGRQTLLERVEHLERAHHIRCSLALCSHADPDQPSPARRTVALLVAEQPGPRGFVWLVCAHRFHSDCLSTAFRVRGDREVVDGRGRRLVECDVKGCHGEGWVDRADWESSDEDQMDEDVAAASEAADQSAMEVDTA